MEIAEAEAARREGNFEPNSIPHSLMLELDLTHRAEKNTEEGGGKVFVRLLWQSKLCVKIANNNYSYYDYHSGLSVCDEVGFCLIALPLCNIPSAL